MQMLNQKKQNKRVIKRSHILLFGSLLIFSGLVVISYNHLLRLRGEVFTAMQLLMFEESEPVSPQEEEQQPVSELKQVTSDEQGEVENYAATINYDQYLGVLRIPKISLKRGFYGLESKYNDIKYNVTLIPGSTMPDVVNGNLMLMAHSGTAYISFFAYLYKLDIGDDVYVTYSGYEYHYKIVNVYNVEKTGKVQITRNVNRTTLTMITCTKDDDYHQTVYIAELV